MKHKPRLNSIETKSDKKGGVIYKNDGLNGSPIFMAHNGQVPIGQVPTRTAVWKNIASLITCCPNFEKKSRNGWSQFFQNPSKNFRIKGAVCWQKISVFLPPTFKLWITPLDFLLWTLPDLFWIATRLVQFSLFFELFLFFTEAAVPYYPVRRPCVTGTLR
jgi:hypothetical protein